MDFRIGTIDEYKSITPHSDDLYFCTDVHEMYVGSTKVAINNVVHVTTLPDVSEADPNNVYILDTDDTSLIYIVHTATDGTKSFILGSAKPDWSENDPSAAGYIENRTHWKKDTITNDLIVSWDKKATDVYTNMVNQDDRLYKVADLPDGMNYTWVKNHYKEFLINGVKATNIIGGSTWNWLYLCSTVVQEPSGAVLATNYLFFVFYNNTKLYTSDYVAAGIQLSPEIRVDTTFPEAGIYSVTKYSNAGAELVAPMQHTTYHPLDINYLPDDAKIVIDATGSNTVYLDQLMLSGGTITKPMVYLNGTNWKIAASQSDEQTEVIDTVKTSYTAVSVMQSKDAFMFQIWNPMPYPNPSRVVVLYGRSIILGARHYDNPSITLKPVNNGYVFIGDIPMPFDSQDYFSCTCSMQSPGNQSTIRYFNGTAASSSDECIFYNISPTEGESSLIWTPDYRQVFELFSRNRVHIRYERTNILGLPRATSTAGRTIVKISSEYIPPDLLEYCELTIRRYTQSPSEADYSNFTAAGGSDNFMGNEVIDSGSYFALNTPGATYDFYVYSVDTNNTKIYDENDTITFPESGTYVAIQTNSFTNFMIYDISSEWFSGYANQLQQPSLSIAYDSSTGSYKLVGISEQVWAEISESCLRMIKYMALRITLKNGREFISVSISTSSVDNYRAIVATGTTGASNGELIPAGVVVAFHSNSLDVLVNILYESATDPTIATPSKAGMVMPTAKTDEMTQDVGIDAAGKLYTKPSPDLPTSLKNPYALVFTGASTQSYDGSSEITVQIPEVPTDVIAANTAARHSHTNKAVLDSITGIVTADNVNNPSHTTDLVDYSAVLKASQNILQKIPETDAGTLLADSFPVIADAGNKLWVTNQGYVVTLTQDTTTKVITPSNSTDTFAYLTSLVTTSHLRLYASLNNSLYHLVYVSADQLAFTNVSLNKTSTLVCASAGWSISEMNLMKMNQGAANAGKAVAVGTDGNITLGGYVVPMCTTADAGKILTVGADGKPEWTVPSTT